MMAGRERVYGLQERPTGPLHLDVRFPGQEEEQPSRESFVWSGHMSIVRCKKGANGPRN